MDSCDVASNFTSIDISDLQSLLFLEHLTEIYQIFWVCHYNPHLYGVIKLVYQVKMKFTLS